MIALETMAVIQGQRSNAGHRCKAVVHSIMPSGADRPKGVAAEILLWSHLK